MISTVEKVLFLKSIDLFSQIPGEELSQIALITDEVQFDGGDEIFREGEPGQTLFFIIDGKVRIHSDGVGEDLAVLGERAVFGEMALLDSEPRSASATANTDVICLKIERDDFNEILAEKGEIAQGIIKVLTRRLRNTLDRRRGGFSGSVPVAPSSSTPAAKATTNTAANTAAAASAPAATSPTSPMSPTSPTNTAASTVASTAPVTARAVEGTEVS